jgi:hypothetical protein
MALPTCADNFWLGEATGCGVLFKGGKEKGGRRAEGGGGGGMISKERNRGKGLLSISPAVEPPPVFLTWWRVFPPPIHIRSDVNSIDMIQGTLKFI